MESHELPSSDQAIVLGCGVSAQVRVRNAWVFGSFPEPTRVGQKRSLQEIMTSSSRFAKTNPRSSLRYKVILTHNFHVQYYDWISPQRRYIQLIFLFLDLFWSSKVLSSRISGTLPILPDGMRSYSGWYVNHLCSSFFQARIFELNSSYALAVWHANGGN